MRKTELKESVKVFSADCNAISNNDINKYIMKGA